MIDELKKELGNAEKEVNKFSKKSKKSFKTFDDAVKKGGDISKKALGIAGAAIAGVGASLLALSASTEEYRNNQAKLTTAFETAGGTAADAKSTYEGLFRVLGDDGQTTEAAAHLAKLTTEQEALSEWTNICQGVYATFGDSLPIEGLTEAANETAKTGTVTGGLADALNWAKLSAEDAKTAFGGNTAALQAYEEALKAGENQEDAFNAALAKCNTEAEREALIRGTLNTLYDDAAKNYEANNAAILAQNEANARLNSNLASLGSAMAPINTAFTNFGSTLLEMIMPYVTDFAENALPKLEEILTKVADAIGAVIGWVVDNWELISTIGIVILSIATAFTVLSTAVSIVTGVMAILTSPVNLVMLAIAALIGIVVLCVMYWDEIKLAASAAWDWIVAAWGAAGEWFSGIWESIKEALAAVGTWFGEQFTLAWDSIVLAWGSVITWFSNLWTEITLVWEAVKTWFGTVFTDAWTSITTAWASVSTWFSDLWTTISGAWETVRTWFGTLFTNAWDSITTAWNEVTTWFSGIWTSISDTFSVVGTWFSDTFSGAWTKIKEAWSGVGNWFSGIWREVKQKFASVGTWFKSKFETAWTNIKDAWGGVTTWFTELWTNVKDVFSDIGTAVKDAVTGTVNNAIDSVVNGAVGIINKFIGMINGAIGIINAIPGVNISTLSLLTVPEMATGGVVNKATLATIGEAGTEAVVPLENNLEWLDKLAGMLNDRMGGGNQPIVLNVDGRRLAEITCAGINGITRQTGTMPLVLV